MNTYYVWQEGQAVIGPYDAVEVKAWIAEGRLPPGTKYSRDGVTWIGAAGAGDLGVTAAAPAAGLAEVSLWIRQGMNIQGPYTMTRIRGYVVQRRVQPYMLFSQDRIYWCGPEHIPGLLPAGYVAVPPPARPTAVPTFAGSLPSAPPPAASSGSPAAPATAAGGAPESPFPAKEVGSITLTGYRLEEADMAPPSESAARPAAAAPAAPPPFVAARTAPGSGGFSYFLRQDAQGAYGPYPEDVIRGWIAENKIGPETEFSRDGRSWVSGASLPAFFQPTTVSRVPGTRGAASEAVEEIDPAPSAWRRFRRRR